MSSKTFTVRVGPTVLERLEKLAKSTGRSRSFLTAEALNRYLDVNERQVEGIKTAMTSLDRGETASHDEVKRLVGSWTPKRKRRSKKA